MNMPSLVEACLATLRRLPGLAVDYQGADTLADGVVTIRTATGTDRYTAHAKQRVTTHGLPALLSELGRLQAVRPPRAMLLTDHLAPGVADELEAKGIAYVDAAGNAHLNGPAAYVLIRGHRRERPAVRTGLTATDLKLVFAILCRPEILHEPLRHIASTTDISLGKVSTTLRRLGGLDHIRELGRQRVLHDSPRLLHRWEVGYLEVVRPRLNPSTWRLPTHTSLEDAYRSALALPNVLIGGEFAADALTRFLKPGSLTLHVPPAEAKRTAVELRLRPGDATQSEVVLVDRFLPGLDQAAADTQPHGSKTLLAHPILARAELLALGSDRLREVADRLRDEVILPKSRHDT